MQSSQAKREIYATSRQTSRGQQIHTTQSDLSSVVGELPKLASKPKTRTSNSSNSIITSKNSAPKKVRPSKEASIKVTSRKAPQASAEKAEAKSQLLLTYGFDESMSGLASPGQSESGTSKAASEFLREHIRALKQAINQIATGAENPLDLAQFEPATEVSAAVVSALKHAAKFDQTWAFSRAQTETFVGQLVYRLEDLLTDYIANNNPRLELVRALAKGLEPTLNAWDESIREDLLNA